MKFIRLSLIMSIIFFIHYPGFGQFADNIPEKKQSIETGSEPVTNKDTTTKSSSQKKIYPDLESLAYLAPNPGDELIKYTKHYYTGLGLMAGGGILASAASFSNNEYLIYAGGILSLAGISFQIESHSDNRKDGELL